MQPAPPASICKLISVRARREGPGIPAAARGPTEGGDGRRMLIRGPGCAEGCAGAARCERPRPCVALGSVCSDSPTFWEEWGPSDLTVGKGLRTQRGDRCFPGQDPQPPTSQTQGRGGSLPCPGVGGPGLPAAVGACPPCAGRQLAPRILITPAPPYSERAAARLR